MEEASRLDPKVFLETIAPLLGVEYTSLLGISTPMDENNQYSQMFDMKNQHGGNLFHTITIQLVCAACMANMDKDVMMNCPHKTTEVPPWKQNSERQDLVRALLATDPAMLLRETAGVANSSATYAFSHDAINEFERRTFGNELASTYIDTVYVTIDPSGGGHSCTAICSAFYTSSNTLVVRAPLPSPSPSTIISVSICVVCVCLYNWWGCQKKSGLLICSRREIPCLR